MASSWLGATVSHDVAQRLVRGVDIVTLRIEAAAKAELYPGHGKKTGAMQRGIQVTPARIVGRAVIGVVGVRGINYALRQHRRFQYITKGFARVKPSIPGILRQATHAHD